MHHSVRGIVLHYINYSDTSIIAKIYTNKLGLQSYIVNGVRKKKARIHLNTFQALNLLDLEVTHKPKSNLHRIIELKISSALTSISYDIVKSSIALFLKELIYKSLKEEEPNEQLFLFLESAFLQLETTTNNVANFHIAFMLEFSKHLGFYPDSDIGIYFNLVDGVFQNFPNTETVSKEESLIIHHFLTTNWLQCHTVKISAVERRNVLTSLSNFYKIHIDSFGTIKSLDVLQTVLS